MKNLSRTKLTSGTIINRNLALPISAKTLRQRGRNVVRKHVGEFDYGAAARFFVCIKLVVVFGLLLVLMFPVPCGLYWSSWRYLFPLVSSVEESHKCFRIPLRSLRRRAFVHTAANPGLLCWGEVRCMSLILRWVMLLCHRLTLDMP